MTKKLRHVEVPLSLPIDCGEKKDIELIRVKRPNTGTAIALTRLIGRDLAKLVMAGGGESLSDKIDDLKEGLGVEALIDGLLDDEKIDGALDIIAGLTSLTREALEQIDLEDLPALFGALLDFFPALKSVGKKEGTDETS